MRTLMRDEVCLAKEHLSYLPPCYACLDTIVDSWAYGILAPSVQKALGILYIEVRISRMHEASDCSCS